MYAHTARKINVAFPFAQISNLEITKNHAKIPFKVYIANTYFYYSY